MADELWRKLFIRLDCKQICMGDLPTTEEPWWGTLKELGFTNYVDRIKFCKDITARKQKEALRRLPSKTITPVNTINPVSCKFNGFRFNSGERSLAAACRSAHTMALTACQTTQDSKL